MDLQTSPGRPVMYTGFTTLRESSVSRFDELVQQYLNNGYVPIGGVAVDTTGWCIAVALPTPLPTAVGLSQQFLVHLSPAPAGDKQ